MMRSYTEEYLAGIPIDRARSSFPATKKRGDMLRKGKIVDLGNQSRSLSVVVRLTRLCTHTKDTDERSIP